MKKYIYKKNGLTTEYKFIPKQKLPRNIPISTPLTFCFIGQNVVLVKKKNGWWDVPGGKMEDGETWIDALKREAQEEAGVVLHNISVIGYVIAKNSGNLSTLKHPKKNVLPVTISFVKKVEKNWKKHETLRRDAFKRSEAKMVLRNRGDDGQLADMFDYAISCYDQNKYDYNFEYIQSGKTFRKIPNTQSMVFVKTNSDKFLVVRDFDEDFFSLPGGGCHLDEDGKICAIREVKEEAQVDVTNIKLIGTVIVRVQKNNVILSESSQQRYIANAKNLSDFIPNKAGSEIVERKEVSIDKLQGCVALLKNQTGNKIIVGLRKKL